MIEGRAGWSAALISAALVFVGVGAAVFTGAGIAAADTETSNGAGSSSGSATNDSSPAASESSSSSFSAAEGADASTDPATVPSLTSNSNEKSAETDVFSNHTSHVTQGRDDDAVDDDIAADGAVAEELEAAATEETTGSVTDQMDPVAASSVETVAPRTSAGDTGFQARTVAVEATSKAAAAAIADESDATADGAADPVIAAPLDSPDSPDSPTDVPAAVVADSEPAPAQASVPPLVADANIATIQTSAAPTTNPRPLGPVAAAVLNLLSVFGWSARPDAVEAYAATLPVAAATAADPNTVTGVTTGHAKLDIPVGPNGYTTHADWYLPTQADGSVSATGVIWLQHGILADKSFYSALAKTLSQQTNSIVVAPNVASFPLACAGCWIIGAPTQEAVASMFLGDRAALNTSANAAGFQGLLPEEFVLSGHSAGGGFATAVGGFYATDPTNDGSLRGVVMFDGVSLGGVLSGDLQKLADPYIPVYQVAAPPQMWNLFGATTDGLVAARPSQFLGATLAGGSHVDSMLGGNPIIDFFAQLVAQFSPPGNTAAVYTLATGWINDLYQGLGPTDGNGIYGAPDEFIVMGDAAAVVLSSPPVVDVNDYLGTWYEVGSVKQFFSIGLVNTKAVYSLNPDGSIKVENSGNYFFDNGPESTIVGSALPVDPANNKLNVSFLFPATANPPGNYWIVDLSPEYSELDPNGWAIVSDPSGFSGFLLSRSPIVSDELYQELLDRASVQGIWGWITPTRQYASGTAAATGLRGTAGTPLTAAQIGGSTFPMGPVRAAILAAEAYIYGYPLLAVQRVQALLGPLNTLNLNTSFANPDADPFWKAIGGGTHPNVNVLYSLASLDLSDGPVVLSIPDMGDRYYSFQLTDPYINVDNYISSNPTEANPIGGPGPGAYAITWIGNQVTVPGAQTVLVDYPSELLLGRVEADAADQQQVVDLMNQWTLTPTGATSVNNAVIPSDYLSPISVLDAISTAITQNPPYPPEQDAAELAKLAQIGVGPDPTDPGTALQVADRLGPLSQLAAAWAVQLTATLLPPLTDLIQTVSAIQHRGWAVTQPEIGDFGTNYLYRAGVAYVGLVANTPDQALYYPGLLDANYLPLNGDRSYALHFAPGQAPPTEPGGFWSLTVYNSDGQLVNSTTPNVYSNGPLVTRPDGSIDVVLSQQNPDDSGANWLQVPAGQFSVYLRIYAPEPAAYEGMWLPPAIERTSGFFGD